MSNFETTIELGDVTLGLRFDFNALAEVERVLSVSMLEAESARSSDADDATQLRAVVFGLAAAYDYAHGHEDPQRTLREIGALITPDVDDRVTEAVLLVRSGGHAEPVS